MKLITFLMAILLAIIFSVFSFLVICDIVKKKTPRRYLVIPVFLELLIIVVFVTEDISHYVLASFMTLFIYLDMFIQKKRGKKSK